MKKEIIESIVQTYQLPVKKRNKIINIAIQKIESFSKKTFEIYSTIFDKFKNYIEGDMGAI